MRIFREYSENECIVTFARTRTIINNNMTSSSSSDIDIDHVVLWGGTIAIKSDASLDEENFTTFADDLVHELARMYSIKEMFACVRKFTHEGSDYVELYVSMHKADAEYIQQCYFDTKPKSILDHIIEWFWKAQPSSNFFICNNVTHVTIVDVTLYPSGIFDMDAENNWSSIAQSHNLRISANYPGVTLHNVFIGI